MNSRLLGTDNGLNMIQQASALVTDASAKAAESSRNFTTDFLNQSQQRAKQLLDLQQNMYEADASRKSSGGFADAVTSVGKLLIQREEQRKKEAKEKEQQSLVLKGTRLKSALETNQQQKKAESQAKAKVDEEALLLLRGDTEAKLAALELSESGVESFRSQASLVIRDAMDRGLTAKDTVDLMNQVNKTAVSRNSQRTERVDAEYQKLQDARVDQAKIQLRVQLTPRLKVLASLPPTEQATPHLQHIEQLIAKYISDPSFNETQRYSIVAAALEDVRTHYGDKSEAFAKFNRNLSDLGNYVSYVRQARAEFEVDGNLDNFNYKKEFARANYGDWEKALAQPGELEKFQAEMSSSRATIDRVENESLERFGVNLDFSEQETQMIAARIISNPAYMNTMESSPAFRSNPRVKAAITLAKQYDAYSKEFAELQEWKAANGTKMANLNMQVASNRAGLITDMAKARAALNSGKKLNPSEQAALDFYQRTLTGMPELQSVIDQFAEKLNSGQKIDPEALKQAANLNEQGLIGVMQATKQEQITREEQLNARYSGLQQYGLLKPRHLITKDAAQQQKQLDERLQRAEQQLQQQTQQFMQPQQYGQQSPFDSGSTYGADVDANGRVRLAPRQRLNTIQINGQKIVTPVLAGSGAPLTSVWKANRPGGRKHAGIDFGQNAGQFSVSLVGGTVGHVAVDEKGYGGYIDIIGDNGYVYRYAHQGSFKFKPGQRVKAGDIVSVSDGSGVGAPHLHFEVHPRAVYENGRYKPQFGLQATNDPMEHLSKLTANDSSVLMPKMTNRAVARANPRMRVPNNAALLPQGGAMLANHVQFIGGNSRPQSAVYNSQRRVLKGSIPWNIGTPQYDYNDDFGYSAIRANPELGRAIVDGAKELGVPAHWIADIIRQEAGAKMSHTTVHNGGSNYGLFGFGNDSFRDVRVSDIRKMGAREQVQLYVRYMKENGWLKHKQRKGANASISDFWAISRMGVAWRKRALSDPMGFLKQRMNDTRKTWADELQLLGKWAGRSYSIPGTRNNDRRSRNSAVDTDVHASCQMCQMMQASNSQISPHTHDIG